MRIILVSLILIISSTTLARQLTPKAESLGELNALLRAVGQRTSDVTTIRSIKFIGTSATAVYEIEFDDFCRQVFKVAAVARSSEETHEATLVKHRCR